MADGRWTMTEGELNAVATGFEVRDTAELPNYKKRRAVDDRDGRAEKRCAFCGSTELETGFGGYGKGFGYRSATCRVCGGITEFVYKDEAGRYFGGEAER